VAEHAAAAATATAAQTVPHFKKITIATMVPAEAVASGAFGMIAAVPMTEMRCRVAMHVEKKPRVQGHESCLHER
jgi:hypothetical protein